MPDNLRHVDTVKVEILRGLTELKRAPLRDVIGSTASRAAYYYHARQLELWGWLFCDNSSHPVTWELRPAGEEFLASLPPPEEAPPPREPITIEQLLKSAKIAADYMARAENALANHAQLLAFFADNPK